MLPTFKTLNSDYNPADVRTRLQDIITELNKGLPDGVALPGLGEGSLNGRYQLLIEDIKKRANHTGIHGFKHNLALKGGDTAEEVAIFVIEQAFHLVELDAPAKVALQHLVGTDPGNPGNEQLKIENEGALTAVQKVTGVAAKAALSKALAEDPPTVPPGEPSAADLAYFSSTTYQYLDKALWHTMRARKARRLIDAYRSLNKGKMPLRNCSETAIATYLMQTYFHHFHKAQVYASPMIALTEFVTHWVAQWREAWAGTGDDDANALRNLKPIYATISEGLTTHTGWKCSEGIGICYGPAGNDVKKATKPLKPMAYTDGTGVFKPVVVELSLYLQLSEAFTDVGGKAKKAFAAAGESLRQVGRSVKAALSSGASSVEYAATLFYEETLKPLFADESIFDEPDARERGKSIRDTESVDEIMRDTKLQFERFSFWVTANVSSDAREKWLKDDRAMKRTLRQMVAGLHDDEKHVVQPPWNKLFKAGGPAAEGELSPIDEARVARMMYDVYSLVEAKDLTKNIKSKWKKFWAPRKDAETAVTLVMLAAGIAISIGTAGAGLPIVALVGIAAAKTVLKKAAMKGVKAANSELNSATLKKGDADPNTELKLTSTEAREGAASLARHFVSSFKNYQRMLALREKFKHNEGKSFYYDNCTAAASYAYAAHAFDHHFAKTVARLHHLTAMTDAVLGTLQEGDTYFSGREFATQLQKIHDAVAGDQGWHNTHCNGLNENGQGRIAASRAGKVVISQNLPSPICYWRHPQNPTNRNDPTIAPYGVARGLFWGDYVKQKDLAVPQQFDMFEEWVKARDVVLDSIKDELKATIKAEKQKIAPDMPEQDFTAVLDRLSGAAKDVP